MGRNTTGIATANTSLRINISTLLKKGWLQRNGVTKTTMTWEGGATIGLDIHVNGNVRFIRLHYVQTSYDGIKTPMDYKVFFESIPSNLGIGEVYYFICPDTIKRCRMLYMAYHSPKFKSRRAYRNRIYYNCQTYSKMNWYNSRYWAIDSQLEELYKERATYTYKGVKTKRAKRIEYLENKKDYMDSMRLRPFTMKLSLCRMIYGQNSGNS